MGQVRHYDVVTGPQFQAGQRPGAGIYRCLQAPELVVHLEDDEPLPPCDKCDSEAETSYQRVVDKRNAVKDAEPPPLGERDTDKPAPLSPAVLSKPDDKFAEADPLRRRKPEPKPPGERLQDFLG